MRFARKAKRLPFSTGVSIAIADTFGGSGPLNDWLLNQTKPKILHKASDSSHVQVVRQAVGQGLPKFDLDGNAKQQKTSNASAVDLVEQSRHHEAPSGTLPSCRFHASDRKFAEKYFSQVRNVTT